MSPREEREIERKAKRGGGWVDLPGLSVSLPRAMVKKIAQCLCHDEEGQLAVRCRGEVDGILGYPASSILDGYRRGETPEVAVAEAAERFLLHGQARGMERELRALGYAPSIRYRDADLPMVRITHLRMICLFLRSDLKVARRARRSPALRLRHRLASPRPLSRRTSSRSSRAPRRSVRVRVAVVSPSPGGGGSGDDSGGPGSDSDPPAQPRDFLPGLVPPSPRSSSSDLIPSGPEPVGLLAHGLTGGGR